MKCFTFIAILLSLAYFCYCETESRKGANPWVRGNCLYNGRNYPPGEHHIRGQCKKITCSPKGWISVHSCIENVNTNRHKDCETGAVVGSSEPFPECCKREYTCVRNGVTEIIRDY